jgi:DNA-binding CsgD family transcriptional regulator
VHGHDLPEWRRAAELTGRRAECGVLDRLIGAVREGQSRSLVLHGEAGVGKSALLEYVAVQALGCRVTRVAGVESEMELAFAGLHQLCAPVLDRLDRLPPPQQEVLRTVFGLSAGPPPDLFMIGLAALSLLSEAAAEKPLLCLVDDHQWLDRCSTQILSFVARRLGAESVGLIFATRSIGTPLARVPDFPVAGLADADARALLDAVLTGPIDAQVRDQLVAEAHGNPLALLELPRGLTPAQLAGGFGLPGAGTIEDSFVRRVAAVPEQTRKLLLLAAADPSGDEALVRRAAARLGIAPEAAGPAVEAGLAEFGTRIRFRHPLMRSAAYRSASAADRLQVHQALAEATDAGLDPDRRAWHRAQATAGPDADVAAELERSAGRAHARGGLAAAAAFLQKAATLTADPALRAGRALAAAETEIRCGGFDAAIDLLAVAEAGPLDDLQQTRADLAHAQFAYVSNRGKDAAPLLLKAANRLEPVDAAMSRGTYLDALAAAIFAGRLADPGGDVLAVARAAEAAPPPPGDARAPDLLLDGLAADYNRGYASALPSLRGALATFGDDLSTEEQLHWLSWATVAAMRTWDDAHWDTLSARHIRIARATGALSELPLALTLRTYLLLFVGDLTAAADLAAETQVVKEATGSSLAPYGALGLAAFRGDATQAQALLDATEADVNRRGEGLGITLAEWAMAVLHNGLGQYDAALSAARRATAFEADPASMVWPMAELVEAAVRSGRPDEAIETWRLLEQMTGASNTSWALGLQARCGALLSDEEDLYREAIAQLEKTRVKVDIARAHLLYGEWLRRERRRTDARDHLRTAHTSFEAMGLAGFAERARRELQAAGGTARKRAVPAQSELTAQETQIARMARDGLSNPEIATRLFISARTVQYHLRKVFSKLDITSRAQLEQALPR